MPAALFLSARLPITAAGTDHPRLARPGEAGALRRLVHEAYAHYVGRMGKPPGPMLDDYAKRIEDRQAWVLEDGWTVLGLVVLEDDGQGAFAGWNVR